jgi:phosphatidylglycerol:prolipoprotein diacylglycerol transferase
MNDLFSIGPVTIHTYGVMMGLGIACAYLMAIARAPRAGLSPDRTGSLALWGVLAGFAGAKLLYLLTRLRDIPAHPEILTNFTVGFVVYGAVLGGVAGAWCYCKKNALPFWRYADLAMPSVALAQSIGRLGCLAAGCCYGVAMSGPLSIVYHSSAGAPLGVPLFPVQVLSSLLDLVLCGVLLLTARHSKRPGGVTLTYFLLYGVGRFGVEFLRGDAVRGSVGVLSTSQFVSLLVFAVCCGIAAFRRYQKGGRASWRTDESEKPAKNCKKP